MTDICSNNTGISNNNNNNNRSKDYDDDDDLYEYLFRLPKVELHAHLNGCIREETLFSLAAERSVTLPEIYFAAPHNFNNDNQHKGTDDGLLYNTLPRSLSDCFAMFAEIPKAVNDLPALRRITREALEDFSSQNTVYLELRSTPKRLWRDFRQTTPGELATKKEYIETILQVMEEFEQEQQAEKTSPMTCRFLVSVDRSQSLKEAAEHVDLAISFFSENNNKEPRVVGMDLGGNPTRQDFRTFQPEFARARAAGLRLTLHCAEIPCDKTTNEASYREAVAVLDFWPDRLGHALLLPRDLQESLLERRIPVETCPTSNVMTLELARHMDGTHLTLLEGLQQHTNLREWVEKGHPLTIATDDPGVFGTNLTKELWLVARTFGMDKDFFRRLVIESMDFAFCDEATKETIRTRLRNH
eukprot:scaffold16330_cov172-Amphora_coffeaeformis.AAC.11